MTLSIYLKYNTMHTCIHIHLHIFTILFQSLCVAMMLITVSTNATKALSLGEEFLGLDEESRLAFSLLLRYSLSGTEIFLEYSDKACVAYAFASLCLLFFKQILLCHLYGMVLILTRRGCILGIFQPR